MARFPIPYPCLYLGKTSLMSGAENGRTDTVKILLEHGADINTKDNSG